MNNALGKISKVSFHVTVRYTLGLQRFTVKAKKKFRMSEASIRKVLFEGWDKRAASGELQKDPDILTKIYPGEHRYCI